MNGVHPLDSCVTSSSRKSVDAAVRQGRMRAKVTTCIEHDYYCCRVMNKKDYVFLYTSKDRLSHITSKALAPFTLILTS